jgi:hypothetical protein
MPWLSILFYKTVCCLPIHPVFSNPSFPTSRLLGQSPTPWGLPKPCLMPGMLWMIILDWAAEPGGALALSIYPEVVRQGFRYWRPGGECLVSKCTFGLCFLILSFGCTHLCRFYCVLAVLSSDPTPQVIPSVVIVKYIVIFICRFLVLPWSFDICMLSHTKSSEIL